MPRESGRASKGAGGGEIPAAGSGVGGGSADLGGGGEFDMIRRFLAGGRSEVQGVRVGPGDDGAVVAGRGIVLSSDLSVEEVHFRAGWLEPGEIGYRAAVAALSDLAAMAARPLGILVSLAVPGPWAGRAAAVMDGARGAAEGVGGMLLGGDLTRSPGPLVIDICVVGEAEAPVLRRGARPGDEVWVTGHLGAAAAAVQALLAGHTPPPDTFRSFAAPPARIEEARWLAGYGFLTAMLDLSDGLAGDVAHIAAASGVAVVLDPARIPVAPAVSAAFGAEKGLDLALSGGEDYELAFTVAPGLLDPLASEFRRRFGISLTRVGMVEAGAGVRLLGAAGGTAVVPPRGFQHFGDGG